MYIIHFRRKRNFYPFKRSDFSSSSSPSSSHAPFRKRNDSRIVIALYLDKFRYRANSHPPWIAYVEKIKINQGTVFDILRGRGGGGGSSIRRCVRNEIDSVRIPPPGPLAISNFVTYYILLVADRSTIGFIFGQVGKQKCF